MFKQITAKVLLFLSIGSLPIKDGKVEFSDEQKEKLNEVEPDFTTKYVAEANRQIAAEAEQERVREELVQLLAENGLEFSAEEAETSTTEEAQENAPEGDEQPPKPKPKASNTELIAQLRSKLNELTAQNKLLAAEDDTPPNTPITMAPKAPVAHSATHLFASSKSYNAFANRPWNQRAAGIRTESTTFSNVEIAKINEDFGAYWAENKEQILSFIRAVDRLPSFWNTISNVGDRIRYAQVIQGEVTQARKKKWLPKGTAEFQPREGKVWPIQIDTEFEGSQLQDIETSWMARFNREGSSPFKTSFIGFLVSEQLRKAFEEDQIGLVKGVFAPSINEDTPGKAINKMSGFRKVVATAKANREYMPYNIGVPTEANIYDYVRDLILRVPEYWRDLPGMVLYTSVDWAIHYHNKRELLKGGNTDYNGEKLTVDQFENIKIQPLHFMQGSNLMVLTTMDNVVILENIPNENANIKFQEDKRNTVMLGDYKKGIHVMAFGRKWEAGEIMDDQNQMVFTNDVEDLTDVYIDQAPDAVILSGKYHNALKTGVNTQATAITNISDVAIGSYVYLRGNTGSFPSTIANGGNFILTSNITLDESMVLVLRKLSDGKFIEFERTDLATNQYITLAAGATTANGALGTMFITVANSGATAITNISSAVAGTVYRIEGGSSSNATTIANGGNFLINGTFTASLGLFIEVRYNGSKFVEINRG